jgi:anti-sigma regulatory factor (Ser/Thr protein kinase)
MKKTKMEFRSDPRELCAVRKFVGDFLSGLPVDESEAALMVLGIDEACANIIRYAYKRRTAGPIALTCERLKHGMRFRLRDLGCHCDPAKLRPRPLDNRRPGGLGLHLIHRAFDTVRYTPRKCGTELVLIRKFRASGARS